MKKSQNIWTIFILVPHIKQAERVVLVLPERRGRGPQERRAVNTQHNRALISDSCNIDSNK